MHRSRFAAMALVLTSTTLISSAGATSAAPAVHTPMVTAEDGTGTTVGEAKSGAVVRVGSFNIKNVVFDRNARKVWPKRRNEIVKQVLNNDVGVLGIQEAQNTAVGVFKYGWNQYLDLRAALNRSGGDYRLTSKAAVDCKNPVTPYRCKYRDRDASRSTRILYDASRYIKLDKGALRYRRQVGSEDQFLVWGLFKTKSTGQRFIFTTTHITSRSNAVKVAQWAQMTQALRRLSDRGRLPVIATGDMNASKFNNITKKALPAIKKAGFGDILNQRVNEARLDNPRARRVVHAWISSLNRGQSRVSQFGQEHNKQLGAGHLDYIFASNRLPVLEWKLVINFNKRTMKVRDPRPSDHNLITAAVVLPRR